jgi:1,4-alpha-glucan branching enzyme
MTTQAFEIESIVQGHHGDPFKILGPHSATKNWVVRSWQPQADSVELLDVNDKLLTKMKRVHKGGLFEARLPLPMVA